MLLAKGAENERIPILMSKVGSSDGNPCGYRINLEIGHSKLAGIVGIGSHPWLIGRSNLSAFNYLIGGLISPAPTTWPVRPRIVVFYSTVCEYLLYRAQSEYGRWKIFHEEKFPGICALVDLEIRLRESLFLNIGAGINRPFVGWDYVDELESDLEEYICWQDVHYWLHEVMRNENPVAFHLGLT